MKTPPEAPTAPPPGAGRGSFAALGGATRGPAEPDPRPPLDPDAVLDARSLSRLKWRCRRGLLENDLFVERFFRHHEETITTRQAAALSALMDLPDNDLLDLLLARTEPRDALERPEVHEVLALLRSPPTTVDRRKEP